MSHEEKPPEAGHEVGLPVLHAVCWPDEQVAFRRAAEGLMEGEALLEPEVPVSRERLLMAGNLGLLMAHAPLEAGGPGHGLGASLLASEAFGTSASWSSVIEPALAGGIDPLLVLFRGSDAERKLLRTLGLGERVALAPRMTEDAFSAVRLQMLEDAGLLEGRLSTQDIEGDISRAEEGDLLLIPASSAAGDRFACFLPVDSEGLAREEGSSELLLSGARVPRPLVLPLPEDAIPALAEMPRLRSAFARIGAAVSLLDGASRLLAEGLEPALRPAGGARGRLASALARVDVARVLAHNAAFRADRAFAQGSEPEPGARLRRALLTAGLLIDISNLGCWYALSSVTALIEETFGGSSRDSARALCSRARTLAGLAGGRSACESLATARDLGRVHEPHLPAEPLPLGPSRVELRESPLAATAQQSASLVVSTALAASSCARASAAAEVLGVSLLALGLDVETSSGEGRGLALETPPSGLINAAGSSRRFKQAMELDRRCVEKLTAGSARREALARLESLWRYGPFRRRLGNELPISVAGPSPPSFSLVFEEDPAMASEHAGYRHALSLAAEAGLLRGVAGMDAVQGASWLLLSLSHSKAFGYLAARGGHLAPSALGDLDPLILLGEGLGRELREDLASARLTAVPVPPSLLPEAFDLVQARREGASHLLTGTVPRVSHLAAADLLQVPCTLPSGERATHLVPLTHEGLIFREAGLDSAGAMLHEIELVDVPVAAGSALPVSGELLDALVLLHVLRDAFDLLGRAEALLGVRVAEGQGGMCPDAGGQHSSPSTCPRLSSARRLCHSCSEILAEEISDRSDRSLSGSLCLALLDRRTLVSLSKVSAWYALEDVCRRQDGDGGEEERRDARPSSQLLVKQALAVAQDLPEELSPGTGPSGQPGAGLVETAAAAAAHSCALLAFEAAEKARRDWNAELRDDLAVVAAAGPALDLWASLGSSQEGGGGRMRRGLGLLSAQYALSAGKRVVEACLSGEALREALEELEKLEEQAREPL